jgi:hypothetical protein
MDPRAAPVAGNTVNKGRGRVKGARANAARFYARRPSRTTRLRGATGQRSPVKGV